MTIIKRCTIGLWDSTIPEIYFDNQGVSNYAVIQQKLMDTYPRGEKGKADWDKILDSIKDKRRGNYDCIVGISGGVDSSYLLYLLKVKYNLNPLAVTVDNGWSTKIAVENIKKITEHLNIDLETYVIDYDEIKDLMKSYMKAGLPWIDIPTDIAIKAVMYKYALKENVKFIFRGNDFRSEGKQPRKWTYGDNRQLEFIQKKFGTIKKLKSFPKLPFWKIIFASMFKGIKDIRPYYYLDYNKREAQEFLEKTYDWKYYGGHHHENSFTKYAMSVWLPDKFHIDKRVINLSAQIMSKSISREEGLHFLSKPSITEKEKEQLTEYIVKKLNFTKAEYEEIWNAENKSYQNYPNSENLLFFILQYLKPLIKVIFKQTPMTFVEMETNKNKA